MLLTEKSRSLALGRASSPATARMLDLAVAATGLILDVPFTPQLSVVLTAPTHGGMARLSLPGQLVT